MTSLAAAQPEVTDNPDVNIHSFKLVSASSAAATSTASSGLMYWVAVCRL